MVLLILESLGSTELLFILAMALVFFGPRKLPQLSRSLGKNLAEFRRASEDFKRTWAREANLEEESMASPHSNQPDARIHENSIMPHATVVQPLQTPTIEPVAPDRVIARQTIQNNDSDAPVVENAEPAANHTEPSRKRDWL